jgi:beta-glucuronidase
VGSANHHAVVWLNGKRIGEHEGGHLPFHLPLDNSIVDFARANRLVIALNNTLSTTSIPPGFVQTNVAGRRIQRLQMDFFHYSGLHRQVRARLT